MVPSKTGGESDASENFGNENFAKQEKEKSRGPEKRNEAGLAY